MTEKRNLARAPWVTPGILAALLLAMGCQPQQQGTVGIEAAIPPPEAVPEVADEVLDTNSQATTAVSAEELRADMRADAVPLGGGLDPATAVAQAALPTDTPSATAARKFEPLFVGWSKPQLVVFVTGRQHGYIEPCGCTGLANQKGGLSRRHTLLKQLRRNGPDVVALDVGNQVRRFGRQPEIKFQTTIEALRTMDYQAVGLGPDDLRLSIGELVAAAAGVDERPGPFVCANVNLFDLTATHRVVRAGGKKVGITAALGTREQAQLASDEIELSAPEDGLRRALAALEAESCDLLVLLAQASMDESKALARKFPKFDIVVTAGGAGEPTREPEPVEGSDAILVQVGTKGMYAGVIGVFDSAQRPLRYQRVPLDARFEDSRDMLDMLAAYQEQLKTPGLEGLGIRPVAHPSGLAFVGSEACADCHTTATEIWEETPHAHATDSLVHPPNERSEIPRHFDPECLSCHVVGWNPQGFFPYKSGYLDLEKSDALHDVGCENCHGPGSAHVAAENGDIDVTDEQIEKLRLQVTVTRAEAEKKMCMECHDLDNSPDFHEPGAFEKYWEKVKHEGKD